MNISLCRNDCTVALMGYCFALRCQWQTALTPGTADTLPEETVARKLFRIFVAVTCWSPPLLSPTPAGGGLPFVYSFILEVCGRGPHCYTTLLLRIGKETMLYLMTAYVLHRFQCFCSKGRAEGGVLRRTCRMPWHAQHDACFTNMGIVSALIWKSCRLRCDSICGQVLSKRL